MAAGIINLQKASGGITKVSSADGTGVTELVLPESGNITSVDTAVTDNAIARYDGTTGKLQNSGVVTDDSGNVGIGTSSPTFKVDIANASGGNMVNATYMGGAKNPYIRLAVNSDTLSEVSTGNSDNTCSLGLKVNGTERMRIDANGVLNVKSSANNGRINIGANSNYIYGDTSNNLILGTSSTDRAIITSSGNLLVGTTTDNGVDKLQVNGSIISRSALWKYNNLNDANTVDEKVVVSNYCLNIPVNDYGYVTIQVSTPYLYCMQTFVCLNSPVRLFIRVLAGGNWSPWTEK